ncbi:MAG: hypothetical protein ACT4NY_06400 [Pseudonocardiales bacterium]
MKRLTRRELNQATLARQLLLERSALDPVDAIGGHWGNGRTTPAGHDRGSSGLG